MRGLATLRQTCRWRSGSRLGVLPRSAGRVGWQSRLVSSRATRTCPALPGSTRTCPAFARRDPFRPADPGTARSGRRIPALPAPAPRAVRPYPARQLRQVQPTPGRVRDDQICMWWVVSLGSDRGAGLVEPLPRSGGGATASGTRSATRRVGPSAGRACPTCATTHGAGRCAGREGVACTGWVGAQIAGGVGGIAPVWCMADQVVRRGRGRTRRPGGVWRGEAGGGERGAAARREAGRRVARRGAAAEAGMGVDAGMRWRRSAR